MEDIVSQKSLLLHWGSFQTPCFSFFEISYLKQLPILFFYLHNNSAMLIPKFPKWSSRIPVKFSWLMNSNFLVLLIFFYKWNVFKNFETSLEECFCNGTRRTPPRKIPPRQTFRWWLPPRKTPPYLLMYFLYIIH